MWTKVEDAWLIAMLQALPLPWPEPAILAWLTYASRCAQPAAHGIDALPSVYWVPSWASSKARARAEKRLLPGRGSVSSSAGVGTGTAQRILVLFGGRQGKLVSAPVSAPVSDSSGYQSVDQPKAKVESDPAQENQSGYQSGCQSVDQSVHQSAPSSDNERKRALKRGNAKSSKPTDKTRPKNLNSTRTSRGRINLADETAFQAIRARELARHPIGMTEEQARAAWTYLRSLTEKHGAIMPRELHSDRRAEKRITACLKAFGGGLVYTGWCLAGASTAGDTAPDEWLRACGVTV